MPRITLTLTDSQRRDLARHASRHGAAGLGKFVAQLCQAYLAIMARTGTGAFPSALTVHEEVARMFDEYQNGEAPDYGTKPVQKRNSHE